MKTSQAIKANANIRAVFVFSKLKQATIRFMDDSEITMNLDGSNVLSDTDREAFVTYHSKVSK